MTTGKKWADLGRLLGFSGIPGLSTQIKNSYTRVILPYEHFCDRVRNNPSISAMAVKGEPRLSPDLNLPPVSNSSATLIGTIGNHNVVTSNSSVSSQAKRDGSEESTPPSSPLSSTSSPLSEPPDDGNVKDMDMDDLFPFGRDFKVDDNGEQNSL